MERGFGWHYPPGMPGPREDWIELACPNVECAEFGVVRECAGVADLGAFDLADENDWTCSICDTQRVDPDDLPLPDRSEA